MKTPMQRKQHKNVMIKNGNGYIRKRINGKKI